MAAALEPAKVDRPSVGAALPLARSVSLVLASLSVVAAVAGAVDGWGGDLSGAVVWVVATLAWAVAGAALLFREGEERLGVLALWFAFLAGAASLTAALAHDRAGSAATLTLAITVALLPAAAMHALLALPSGVLGKRFRLRVAAAYPVAVAVGAGLWSSDQQAREWPVAVWAVVAAGVGVDGALLRYRDAREAERRRMHWAALGIAAAVEIVLVASTLHVLVGRPERFVQIAAVAAIPLPLALSLGVPRRFEDSAERRVCPAVCLVGVTALTAAVYLLVVVGLGRPPTSEERTTLVLSMVAAGISALLYVPARRRLIEFSNHLVHGKREAPDDVVRTFGARLSRAVPLEELLLQLAESLRAALALKAAEIWAGPAGVLDRVVSDPDRGPARLRLHGSEEAVLARTGVTGPARIAVWLPQLLSDRDGAVLRVAPVAHGGELFGLIVVERQVGADQFDEQDDATLADLARQVGLVLRNARLDSDLQASLEQLRQKAEELRASRARVVAAADAERRRIERDLHDGAQQYLVGLEVNLGVVSGLVDSDTERAKAILDELRASVQEAMQDFRDLAHGIYPPLLQDRGLAEALANTARRATIPTRVEAAGLGRYEPEIEAAVYFCCVEALQNAAKHAGEGARATIRLWEGEGALLFEVADDGPGLDPAEAAIGAGLTNMGDRLEAVGGSLRIESAVGDGTRVAGTIPLAHRRG